MGVSLLSLSLVRASRPSAKPAPIDEAPAPTASPSSVVTAAPQNPERAPAPAEPDPLDEQLVPPPLAEQRSLLIARMRAELALNDAQLAEVGQIFSASKELGQGNPKLTRHAMSRGECKQTRAAAGLPSVLDVAVCGAKNMVPIWGAGQSAETALLCIDIYEFPDLACEFPVVNVRASEADALCRAVGKRLCDAHEWEGACAGELREPSREYEWNRPRIEATWHHNQERARRWAYGPERNQLLCATSSERSPGCDGGGFSKCGSNTYPAGAFPACKSPFGVYDQHGNVAEHMSLPSAPSELKGQGLTEMKGSWFIFATTQAHEDDCRWRAPDWHGTRVRSPNAHRNYHLGFRCCKDLGERREAR